MQKQSLTLEEEKRGILIERINLFRDLADVQIRRCEISKKELIGIRESPVFLKIFLTDEVVEINLTERRISEISNELNEIKQLISLENPKFVEEGTAKRRLEETEVRVNELLIFIRSRQAKIPEPKQSILLWIFHPYFSVDYLVRKCIHKIIMARQEKKMRKVILEGEELERQKRKRAEKIRRLKK